jgi:hypothetical protein
MDFSDIRQLFDISDNSFCIDETIIVQNESRLRINLPKILKEYYLQLGNHEALNQSQNYLVLPQELQFDDNDLLVFYTENQFVVLWGIKRSDLSLDNPPVYSICDEDIELESPNLSTFLTAMAYLQAVFSFTYNANRTEISKITEEIIQKTWKKSNHSLKTWNVEFYQNNLNEILAVMKNDEQIDLFIATKTEESFKEINYKLNIEWDYSYEEDI